MANRHNACLLCSCSGHTPRRALPYECGTSERFRREWKVTRCWCKTYPELLLGQRSSALNPQHPSASLIRSVSSSQQSNPYISSLASCENWLRSWCHFLDSIPTIHRKPLKTSGVKDPDRDLRPEAVEILMSPRNGHVLFSGTPGCGKERKPRWGHSCIHCHQLHSVLISVSWISLAFITKNDWIESEWHISETLSTSYYAC